ncbi:hypothetical protein ACVRY7_01990 [Streptococcus ictaluri]|uniref:Uncharacterized protein n=1 Tax=Streptococcus ictaluri 707-05 TaxID=764299 RepID=G5K4V7_9STRE|nr:hypothetical protein [Streptococcus ictaluri]EHI69120.1 hypothetical protein STRIC_1844 [Streptococcus ictaluri 707-05]
MNKKFKYLSVILLLLISIGTIFSPISVVVSAQTVETEMVEYSDNEIKAVAEELKFYFSEAGYLDDDGVYHVTNPELIKQKADSGSDEVQDLYDLYLSRNAPIYYKSGRDFIVCIARDYFGVYIDILNGNVISALQGYVLSQQWERAAFYFLQLIGKSTSKANIVATAGQLAVAVYNCRSKL